MPKSQGARNRGLERASLFFASDSGIGRRSGRGRAFGLVEKWAGIFAAVFLAAVAFLAATFRWQARQFAVDPRNQLRALAEQVCLTGVISTLR
jgi:hypothetical protein